MKKLIISHGDKGGVGKSVIATTCTEALLAAGQLVALVEGDPSQPDVGARYTRDPGVKLGALPLARAGAPEAAVADLSYWLETDAAEADAVVINLPAGASETLDGLGGAIREVADALGYEIFVTYSLGKGEAPARGLGKSLKGGLLSHVDPDKRLVLFPLFQGHQATFAWYRDPARAAKNFHEAAFPELSPVAVFNKFLAGKGRWEEIKGAGGLMVYDKIAIGRWLDAATAALAPVLS